MNDVTNSFGQPQSDTRYASCPPSQFDADVDGYGNTCDADLTGDGIIGIPDYAGYLPAFGTVFGPGYCAACDFTEDGIVGIPDFSILLASFGGTPDRGSAWRQAPAVTA